MFARLVVPIPFSQSEIDHIHGLDSLPFPNHKIISLDVPMYKPLAMNLFQPGDDLNTDINCGGKTELFLTK